MRVNGNYNSARLFSMDYSYAIELQSLLQAIDPCKNIPSCPSMSRYRFTSSSIIQQEARERRVHIGSGHSCKVQYGGREISFYWLGLPSAASHPYCWARSTCDPFQGHWTWQLPSVCHCPCQPRGPSSNDHLLKGNVP